MPYASVCQNGLDRLSSETLAFRFQPTVPKIVHLGGNLTLSTASVRGWIDDMHQSDRRGEVHRHTGGSPERRVGGA